MKRFLIFLGIGPLIGYAVLLFIAVRWYRLGPIQYENVIPNIIAGIPLAYALGLLPALAAAGVDWLLRGLAWRVVPTTIVGLMGSSIWAIGAYLNFHDLWNLLSFAAVGGIAAAVCSWLSTIGDNTKPNP
jgi:hypothetical protein